MNPIRSRLAAGIALTLLMASQVSTAREVPFADPVNIATELAGPNLLRSIDYKLDGDDDLYYVAGSSVILLTNKNDGSGFTRTVVANQPDIASLQPAFLRPGQGYRLPDLVLSRRVNGGTPAAWMWLANDQSDNYTAHVIATLPSGTDAGAVNVIDANRDGRPDLLFTSKTGSGATATSRIALYLASGPGNAPTYTLGWEITDAAAKGISDIAVADFDRDGWPDFAAAGFQNDQVAVYRNTGSSGTTGFSEHALWTDAGIQAAMGGPLALAVGDFDRNGSPDLVVSAFHSDRIGLIPGRPRRSTPALSANVVRQSGAVIDGASAVATADFDHDGDPDIVATSMAEGRAVLLEYDRSLHTWQAYLQAAVAGTSPLSVATVDTDRDGDEDIVRANLGANNVTVQENSSLHASAVLVLDRVVGGSQNEKVYGVPTADYTGDGRTDLGTSPASNAPIIGVLEQQPAGSFTRPSADNGFYSLGLGVAPHRGIVFGDFSIDGRIDWFGCVRQNSGGTRRIMFRNGEWNGSALRGDVTVSRCEPRMADYDGDGDPDLLIPVGNGLNIDVNEGSFPDTYSRIHLALDKPLFDYATIDFDRDGDIDIVYSVNANPATEPSQLRWLANDGAGTFGGEVDIPTGGRQAGRLQLIDVDNNGRLDIVASGATGIASTTVDTATPFWVSGSAGFAIQDLGGPSLYRGHGITAADIDHDGDIDIGAIDDTPGVAQAYLYEQTSTTSYPRSPIEGVKQRIYSLTFGDVNGDSWPDALLSTDDDGLLLIRNVHGSLAVDGENIPGLAPRSSQSVVVAKGVVDHLGRAGDAGGRITGLDLDFIDATDAQPFTLAELKSFLSAVLIYADQNGNGTFDSGDGMPVDIFDFAHVSALPLSIDPDTVVNHGSAARFFIQAQFTHTAGTLAPQIQVHLDSDSATGEHADAGTPVDVMPGQFLGSAFTVSKGNPYFLDGEDAEKSIDEYLAVGAKSGSNLAARDPDQPAEHVGLTYQVTGGSGQGRFDVEQGTGKFIYLGGGISEGQTYTLVVRATDEDGQFTANGFDLNIVDGNDPPTMSVFGPASVAEFAANNALIFDFNATDGDGGAPDANIDYSIVASSVPGALSIDIDDGELRVADRTKLREITSISITLRLTDDAGWTAEIVIPVTVIDGDDPVVLVQGGPFDVYIGSPAGTVIGQVIASNDDGPVEYYKDGGTGLYLFDIDVNTGVITLTDPDALVAGTTYDYLLQIPEKNGPNENQYQGSALIRAKNKPAIAFRNGFEDPE